MSVASHYGITLADVSALRLWEFNILVDEMNEAEKADKRPPGSTPVIT